MNGSALTALLPIGVLSAAAVLIMLAIGVKRDIRLIFRLSLTGLVLTSLTLPRALSVAPQAVTGLLSVDAYAVYFMMLILGAALVVVLLAQPYFLAAGQGDPEDRPSETEQFEELFLLIITATLGAMVMVCSRHFAMFFLGLEILSVSLFPMIAYRTRQRTALEAGIKYLMLSGVSSALLLFGMALVYCATGVLSFSDLAQASPAPSEQILLTAGACLMLAGLGFKLSLVPFHLWTPDVYQGAPAPVTAFVATVSKGAVFALLLRLWIDAQLYRIPALLNVLSVLAILSIVGGNLLGLLQASVKRMLAYSSIAHLGYLLVALIAGTLLGSELLTESVSFYLMAYMLSNLGALGVVSALSDRRREMDIQEDYTGLFWRRPWLAAFLTLNLLSLAGIPLTMGFVGKFYVFAGAAQAQIWLLVWTVALGSGIGLFYYLRVILRMSDTSRSGHEPCRANGAVELLALGSLALLLLWGGLAPEPLMQALRNIAKGLMA
jgi:NADH-quinone oxidoreductase subunit N